MSPSILIMLVFLLPVGMLLVSHRSVGSTQSVPGTLTTPGDNMKLVITGLSTAYQESKFTQNIIVFINVTLMPGLQIILLIKVENKNIYQSIYAI